MEKSQRNALIVLLVFSLVVFAVVGWGVLKHDDSGSQKYDKEKAGKYKPPPFLAKAGAALRQLGPKLDLNRHEFVINPGDRQLVIRVPPAKGDGDEIRKGTFHLDPGQRGTIDYVDEMPDKDMHKQPLQFPAGDDEEARKRDDPMAGSIVVMKRGGTLTISCAAKTRCRFRLD